MFCITQVNKLWEVKVKGRIILVYKDPTKNEFQELPSLWTPTIRVKRENTASWSRTFVNKLLAYFKNFY